MEFNEVLAQRRMRRAFEPASLSETVVTQIFCDSLRAPTAGHCRGISWITLIGPEEVARYFHAATDETWRQSSPRYEGLRHASAIGICVAYPEIYRERYAASDKAASGLGEDISTWPIPYWIGDAGAASLAALLLIEDANLGGCFLGAFRNESALRSELGLSDDAVIYGAVLLGQASSDDHQSASLARRGPTRSERVSRILAKP
jgi:nitroreductase